MKIHSLIAAVLALGCLAFALSPPETVLRVRTLVADANGGDVSQLLGSFTVPDRPAEDGTWEQFGVSEVLLWDAEGHVENGGAPLPASPDPQATTFSVKFWNVTRGGWAFPGNYIFGAPMTWPALNTGEEFTKSLNWGNGYFTHTWWFTTWTFPSNGWVGIDAGDVIQVYVTVFVPWLDWEGYFGNPDGLHFYSSEWDISYALTFEWQQQEQ
jgi:hypothetical protein